MVFMWRLSVCVLVVLSTIGRDVVGEDVVVVVVIFLFYSDSS